MAEAKPPIVVGAERFSMMPTEGCTVETKEGEVLLSGSGYLASVQSYVPPFVIHAEARTDATNIRLYYGKGRVIFNWELNPRQLRVHDVRDGRGFAFDGLGYVLPNAITEDFSLAPSDGERVRVRGSCY